ncbi:MAG: hypothetical protein A2W52_00165 [Candidatus Taylorbacteria bacterium RIFCSPHIGHO2_02_49_25]|uniref:Adenine DNA glycosylase n=1 Tax=Candidatus Taylorbacteria bacterium RIFCSPHIGHO2_02_49_25 TaxID=1802305 RepID=A0A1G2MJG6_9BACT|nr:MAG: HhH-GPD family protein [Parcubacteria group bacterium GW2011_GWF2_50_9]OHA19721.1 MAG: hypothetical protein A2759_04015 [Candidatus Taylorbacteria bacterium RIFCSPHIGHO2_01_FULL_49_60]OHA23132.1 MAG: hypothetical protein A2W52_00165 [Candidatus Taylorbacteria bacterium RIFCSPHIGHO2_02_49_25]OHA35508.1 MAG: hypothetical protein A3B27_00320 [Candidatus Taylorbacteria bacterium RIFCSPLOWO2_01_FULL_50_130]OHA35590.1 MAG: hypothetical protein A2W65_00845 [Candidatus Taylorbacteria bacterium 
MSVKDYENRARFSEKRIIRFQNKVLDFYRKRGRVFPWRNIRDPYAILVSEVMLQQTQVDRVVPKYLEWLKRFPTVSSLACAPKGEVIKAWQGLGYNRRALHLKRAAEVIATKYKGKVPRTLEELQSLPGIGPYTSGAIAAFAFGMNLPFIETNIRTVFIHFFFRGKKKVRDEEILELVVRALPNKVRLLSRHKVELCSVREWYNALMDCGAMLKRAVGNVNTCAAKYAKQSAFKGSRKEIRGAILRRATEKEKVTLADFKEHQTKFSVPEIFSELASEGFLRKIGEDFTLA